MAKKKEVRSVAVNIRITPTMRDALERLAQQDQRSLAGLIVVLLEKAIADAETKSNKRRN